MCVYNHLFAAPIHKHKKHTLTHTHYMWSQTFVIKSDLKRIITLIVNSNNNNDNDGKKINYFSVPNGTIDDIT